MANSILEVKNISKAFGGVHAVNACSFTVREKQITALIGPNGAGKTTLFNVVNGFIKTDAGEVLFRGAGITNAPVWRRSRAGLSRTFQLSRIFKNLSIRDNLVLAIRQDDDRFWTMLITPPSRNRFDAQIKEMLAFVGLEKDINASVTALSYGEQKLFDLARALLNPHTILLLDEPVAGVNPVIRGKLKEIMLHLKERGETVLLIEHDMDFVRSVADRVIVMDQGGVLVEGKPEAVLKDKRVLEAYLGSGKSEARSTKSETSTKFQ